MTRILSLDDWPEIVEILGTILQAAGCEVLTTTDSYEAWALLHSVPVDVLTQDFMRSDIDGIELLLQMKSDENLRAIPVLAITAGAREVRTGQLKQCGLDIDRDLDGFIQKPFRGEQLLDMVEAILENNIVMLDRGKSRLAILEMRTKRPRIETLIQALKDGDPSVRLGAINSLKWLKDTRAVEPLLSLLSDSEIAVRWAAIHTLGLLNDRRAVRPLIALLSDADILNRWAAALALGRLGAKEALKPLVAALADENSLVRMTATLGLGCLKEPSVVTSLRERLTDNDPMVGRAAREALKDTKTQGHLRKAVQTGPKREKKQANPLGGSTHVWFWRLVLLVTAGLIGVAAYDHWTEEPPTLFEQLLSETPIPRHKLEESIPSYLDRGYSCDEILRTIAEVLWFVRERVLKAPAEEVESLLAVRLAEERHKRAEEAQKHPHVYHGGLMWLRLKKAVFGYPQYPALARCP